MKLFIMTDLEGVAGIINGKDYLVPNGRCYEAARRLLMQEINAAIAGFAAGGFTEFLVADGHGAGATDIELLDPRARLIRGWGENAYPFGLTKEHDAMAYVGQHAKSGTPFSHLTHTQWWNVLDEKLNGVSIGEYGEGAYCAGELNIPVIFAAGEKALADEANKLTPWVETAAVLEGVIDTTGEELTGEQYETCHEGAIHMQPKAACELIRAIAQRAAQRFAHKRDDFKLLRAEPPFRVERFFRPYRGQPASQTVHQNRTSVIDLYNGKTN